MPEKVTDAHGHHLEWITCTTCGKEALVRAGGKGFCSKKCVRGINKGQKHAWKGDLAGYSGFHRRVYRARGKADHCQQCGASDPARRFEWANLTGRLDDPNDYAPMCVPCHRAFDAECRPYGSRHPQAKLTEAVVREARERHLGGVAIKALARDYGVADMTISRAISRETWRHVA